MIPLTHKDRVRGGGFGYRLKDFLVSIKRFIFSDRNSRNLFMFLTLNLFFAVVELLYGHWTNSLGLISDSYHMFFDCSGLVFGLVASVITKWKATARYSYGYVRAEVLAGFVNSLFLISMSFSILWQAVDRVLEPQEVKHERLFMVSVLGLVVNLVGIYAFQHGHGHSHGGGGSHGHSHGGGGGGGHNHSHNNHEHESLLQNNNHSHSDNHHGHSHGPNSHHDSLMEQVQLNELASNSQIMRGVFLHILADTLGSVGVIVSTLLMQWFGWMIADPICSIFIAVLILLSVYDLIKESFRVLMQGTPQNLEQLLPQCYQRVTGLAGVYAVQEPHFWTLCSDVNVGAIKLEVSKSVDPKYVQTHTRMIFEAVGVKQIYIQLDYV